MLAKKVKKELENNQMMKLPKCKELLSILSKEPMAKE